MFVHQLCLNTSVPVYIHVFQALSMKTSAKIDFGNCDNFMLSTADKVLARNVWIRHRTVLARVSDTAPVSDTARVSDTACSRRS